MHWIISSLLMLISSVVLYLCVRKSNTLQTPQQLNNFAMFFVPACIYLLLAVENHTTFSLTPIAVTIIVIQGIFFSYLGNVLSLKGIQLSPNPGYSLIISKSYVVMTAVASVFLFGAALPVKSIFAILFILGFSSLIMIDPHKKNSGGSQIWLTYTMGAFFCWGLLALSTKYLLNIGVPILTRLIYSMIIVCGLILSEMRWKKIGFGTLKKNQLNTLLIMGVSAASFNYFMQLAYTTAPNVGFVNATNAGSISLLTLLSAYFFKDELSVKKLVGIVGVTVGLILLFL